MVMMMQCDRVQPCQACCARGQPKECTFAVSEKDDYEPIKQSYEIRELRKENQRLKERLRARRDAVSSPEGSNDEGLIDRKRPPKVPSKPTKFQQRRFKTSEPSDSLYFGSPGLANVVADVCPTSLCSRKCPNGLCAKEHPTLTSSSVCQHATPQSAIGLFGPYTASGSRHFRIPGRSTLFLPDLVEG